MWYNNVTKKRKKEDFMATFQDFKLQEYCNQVIKELGFKKPTPIQEKVIPLVLKNRDIIGISQTGTGKSHAFLLPIMSRIDVNKDCVQAVITAPTRELASQLFNNAKTFTKYLPELRVSLIVGGSDRQRAVNKLSTQPHVVIGTPGRIKDLSLDAQALQITTAKTFVVDEADMTLEFGYLEDIDAVAGKMADDLQMMVFSATIPQNLRPFLKKYMQSPITIEIDSKLATTANVEHILLATKHQDRYDVLKKIMATIDPYICIIFANKRTEVSKITRQLREDGYKVGEIHGDLEPRERKKMMHVELILMVFLMSLICNFQQNLIFIFIEVDVQGVETIQVFVIVCMIQQMKKILQFLKEKELNLRICNLKTDNLWI